MAEILLSNRTLPNAQLEQQCSITGDDIYGEEKSLTVSANQPYLIGKEPSRIELAILHTLRNAQKNQQLTEIALSLGEDETVAIAEMMKKLQDDPSTLIGSATGTYGTRASGFKGAVYKYQQALMQYRNTITSKAPKASQLGAKQAAFRAFNDMQHKFQLEMNVITSHSKARKGTALTNPTRATNIARHGRNAAKLNVTSQAQAHDLVNLSKHAKTLGTGLVMLDFAGRIGKIHNSYQADGNWEREMFIESSSFAASAAGSAAVAGVLSFFIFSTPLGWVGLIAGGAAITTLSAGTSIYINDHIHNIGGKLYDNVMDYLREK